MPKVPTYNRQVASSGLPSARQTVNATPEDFGAGFGRELQNFGATVGDAFERKEKADGEARAAQIITQAELDNLQRFEQSQQSAEAGAKGFTEGYLEQQDAYYDELLAGVDNQYAKQIIEKHKLQSKAAFGKRAIQFQAEEGVRYRGQQLEEAASNEAELILRLPPEQVDIALEQAIQRGNQRIDAQPATPEQKAELKEKDRKKKVEAAWARKLETANAPVRVSTVPSNAPRGIRNNNPGNIRPSGDEWQGMTGDDGGYVQFATPEAGLRAMGINLVNQTRKHGLDTVRGIITKYAPDSENDTESYIKAVSGDLFIDPDTRMDLESKGTLTALMTAMIKHENGQQPYTQELISYGADLALTGQPAPDIAADDVSAVAGDITQYMTTDEIIKYRSQMAKLVEADRKLRLEDIGEWGIKRGYTPEQVVALGSNPATAPVLPKKYAKQVVQFVNEHATGDTVIAKAEELKQVWGGTINNAMIDLKRANMPLAHLAAMELAIKNPAQFKDHIDVLMGLGREEEANTNETLKTRTGKTRADIADEVASRLEEEDLGELIMREVSKADSQGHFRETTDMIEELAKAYMIQRPSEGIEKAVEWALEAETSRYQVGRVNGNNYRVPNDYKLEDIETRVEEYIDRAARGILKSEDLNYLLDKDAIIPVITQDEKGLFFIDVLGNPMREIPSVTFEELVNTPTIRENRELLKEELEGKSYNEREQFRREALGLDVEQASQKAKRFELRDKLSGQVGD